MMQEYIIVFLFSFLVVFFLTPLMIKFSHKINFVDNPNARKLHKTAKPVLGGLSVFLGFIPFAIYVILIAPQKEFDTSTIGFLLGGLIILLVGLIDDKVELSPKIKLLGQVISCLVFIYCNNLMTIWGGSYLSTLLIMAWMIGLMNAFNFLDNMDGILAGMSGFLSLGFFFLTLAISSQQLSLQSQFIALISLSFAGAVFGFLPYNFNPSKIFLGDAGSMFIGYFLSTVGILMGRLASLKTNSYVFYLLPVLLLSYAIFDISLVSYTRTRDKRGVMQGGKDHSTHRVCTAIGSTKLTAIFIYFINLIISGVTFFVLLSGNKILLIIMTTVFILSFIFFGKKLDKIPIIVTENQKKHQEKKNGNI